MIRRDVPREADEPSHWLLIPQVEHARLSHQLAGAWRDLLPSATDAVREEFLAAVLHHDDGWEEWRAAPRIDPEHGRPYSFTEMPPADAQAIWSQSIDACRAIGPLAGWVVTSHFIDLQSKQDDDYPDWSPWLKEQGAKLPAWDAEWRAIDPANNTPALAQRCLYLLQQLDWLSLWLCCRGPVDPRDPRDSLDLGSAEGDFGPFTFAPTPRAGALLVTPWPFVESELLVTANAQHMPIDRYEQGSGWGAVDQPVSWRLAPG